jgi:hypothetical protein
MSQALLLAYSALRVGKVDIIAPILSTEGAVAAVISVAAGEPVERAAGWLLVLIVLGVVLAAAAPDPVVATPGRLRPLLLATLAARLTRLQLSGVSIVALGVAVLSAVRA